MLRVMRLKHLQYFVFNLHFTRLSFPEHSSAFRSTNKMAETKNEKNRSRLFYFYIAVGTLLWGVLGYPFVDKFLGDPFIGIDFFFSALISFLSMTVPFFWELPLPSKGKEYLIILYPLFTFPLIIIGVEVREFINQ